MAADFFYTGAVDLFVRQRSQTEVGPPTPPTPIGATPGTPDDVGYRGGGRPRLVPGEGGGGGGGPSQNSGRWLYLGSAVVAPIIDAVIFTKPLTCDRSGDGVWNKVGTSEQHIVSGTFNRLNWRTLSELRTGDSTGVGVRYKVTVGQLLLNVKDCELFIKFAQPNIAGGLQQPDGAGRGRLYYSAKLEQVRETVGGGRVMEVGLVFECNPLWFNTPKEWLFWTESENDLPLNLKPE